ncbi:MBL fold metallo-hydrolase [Pedobacter sp. BS3]|uniref:MBL fold metallo-hydrolase n=1 Tax=Pedobacter sp. BS3 TaxID=2567937 RepID=UPI0011ECC2EB|nr:MBL fold metallo-hydrolase [Pedobacter sp. BS3]TZF83861.1 MBL fold metallo-hydrolase [Pedobacter sp. BS3]
MSLFIASLNSGSNGNCYYIGNSTEAILVDAGISCRETERRMKRLGLSLNNVKAIFVSHEHTDHIRGIPVLAKKYQVPVYITEATCRHGRLLPEEHLFLSFCTHQQVSIGGFTITAFPKFHDAAEPHSFLVSYGDINIGVFTDIGRVCEHVIHHFKQCHAAFLEANYDEVLLETGRYPYYLKNRIRGGYGHLSNTQALELFKLHKPDHMSHLILAHLSKDNNRPELVQQLFDQHAGNTQIIVASRYEETAVYRIGAAAVDDSATTNSVAQQIPMF